MKKLTGANGLVKSLLEAVEENQTPAIDVGEVKEYKQEKHLTTLNYGQTPPPDNTAPSVTVKVDEDNDAILNNKSIASPFAWQKCGLIVPIYPGMRALLAHNLGLTNDAVVAGFLWSQVEAAEQQPPKNMPGDYWLCLPTELNQNQQPTGKGVNDLTDKSGLRVIEAKGLRIFVGDNKLKDVGERPSVPDAKTIVIEHESGTKISIGNDGALKIEMAQGKEMSLVNGSNTVTVSNQSVEIKAAKISITSTSDLELTASGVIKMSSKNIKSDDSGTSIL